MKPKKVPFSNVVIVAVILTFLIGGITTMIETLRIMDWVVASSMAWVVGLGLYSLDRWGE